MSIIFLIIIILYLILILYIDIKKIYKKDFIYNKKYSIKKDLIKIDKRLLLFEKYKRNNVKWPLPREIKFKPQLKKEEVIAFSFFMKPGNIYFEFGSGGTTNIASYYNVTTFSVESDIKWHKLLKDNNIKANYITIDLKTKELGYPGKGTNIEDWKKYIQAYKKNINADIILIDGRFRVACALDIFNKIRNDTIVLIHDYIHRKEYFILEKFYLRLKRWSSLVAFIKRPEVNLIPRHIYLKYLNIFNL